MSDREATPPLPDDGNEEGEINPDDLKDIEAANPHPIVKHTNVRYYTREELQAANPLVQDGMDPMVLMELRSDTYRFLRKLGETLYNKFDQPPYTVAAAASLCHRYFRRRSMLLNDRYIVAAAAFFIAGKTTYVPRALSDVALGSFRIRCEKDLSLLQHYEDARIRRDYEDAILAAEANLLNANALGFQAIQDVETMMTSLHEILNEELARLHRGEGDYDEPSRQKAILGFEALRETARNLALDIFRADIVLMFPGPQLAIALLRVALRLVKEKRKLPPNYNFAGGPQGEAWYHLRGVDEALMEGMLKEVYGFLNRKAPHPSKVPQVEPIPPDILDVKLVEQEEKAEMEAKGMLVNPYADLAYIDPYSQQAYGAPPHPPPAGPFQPRPPSYPPGAHVPAPPPGAPPAAPAPPGRFEITYDDL